MKIFNWAIKVSKEDPMQQYDFKRFEEKCGDFYLVEARFKFSLLNEIKDKKVVYLQVEEPNRFMSPDVAFRGDEYDTHFYKILTCCPYTMEWLNKKQGTNRRMEVFIPVNEEKIPPITEKKYDVIYIGNINSKEIKRNIQLISKFNYRFVARTSNFGYINKIKFKLGLPLNDKLITNQNVDYKEKMKLLSETKVALVHGVLYCTKETLRAVWNTPDIENNKAFSLIPKKTWWRYLWSFVSSKEYLVPQLKTRFSETAIAKSLMLVRNDPFNIVERWYTPDKDFVYYEEGKLKERIEEILKDWNTGKYQEIIESAFEKTKKEYTTEDFFEKYLKNLK